MDGRLDANPSLNACQPATIIAQITRLIFQLTALHARLKFSNFDKNTFLFINRYKGELANMDMNEKLRFCQSLVFKRDITSTSVTSCSKLAVQNEPLFGC